MYSVCVCVVVFGMFHMETRRDVIAAQNPAPYSLPLPDTTRATSLRGNKTITTHEQTQPASDSFFAVRTHEGKKNSILHSW